MSWQSLGAVIPKEGEWLDYAPSTEAPGSPTEGLLYRLTGLNVGTFDPDQFYALLRFKYGETYSRATIVAPVAGPTVISVDIPPAIALYPFSWLPQVQLVHHVPSNRPRVITWALQIDEFVGADVEAIEDLSRFLY